MPPRKDPSNYQLCPGNHKLPHETKAGVCTAFWCGTVAVKELKKQNGEEEETGGDPGADGQKMMVLSRRHKLRLSALDSLPQGLSGADAEEFVNNKMAELSVLAVAEQEYQLRFGDEKQRAEASRYVLDSTGHGKRTDGGALGIQPIIIITDAKNGAYVPPWSKAKVVDAQVKKLPSGDSSGA